MRYSARQAIPSNLAVSLVTLGVSLATRASTLPLVSLGSLYLLILSLAVGAVVAAFFGTSFVRRISDRRLDLTILGLLVVIGAALIVEGFVPATGLGVVPVASIWLASTGILFGLAIGSYSSVLGVAGGELIIPTLIFAYGVDVKTAGTASLVVSLPTVVVGLARYARQGAFDQPEVFRETIVPMGTGSVIGAIVGGFLVGLVPAPILKVVLGLALVVSALRIFSRGSAPGAGQPDTSPPQPVGPQRKQQVGYSLKPRRESASTACNCQGTGAL
jgi:uncharacterized membrane protein YfcA